MFLFLWIRLSFKVLVFQYVFCVIVFHCVLICFILFEYGLVFHMFDWLNKKSCCVGKNAHVFPVRFMFVGLHQVA